VGRFQIAGTSVIHKDCSVGRIIGARSEGRDGMKGRIAIWAILGALVVVVWGVYISTTLSNPLGSGGIARALIYLSCPIAMASRHAQSFYFVLIANAATYALAGAVVETMRRYVHIRSSPRLSH
jgi:hypothetical protein